LLAAAAWLIKALVSNRLALDVEKFKIEMKASADAEIERTKAFLTRAMRVHERQVDILTKLYRHFLEAQLCLQTMTSSGIFEGQKPEGEMRCSFANAIASALDTLSDGRLLIPPELTQQCDRFFTSLFEGQTHLNFAKHLMIVDGLERAANWDRAKQTAYEEVPSILQQIEKAARDVIHGEPPPSRQ